MSTEWNRYEQFAERIGRLDAEVKVIQTELIPLKEGVSNFRAFQVRGSRYFDKAEARMEAEDDRRQKEDHKRATRMGWYKIASGIIGPLMVAFVIWLVVHWYNFTEDMIHMDEEWHAARQMANHTKSWLDQPNPAYTVHRPQDAGIPTQP